MIKIDEDSLICDLAETYQIYDYKQLSPTKIAVFACGLRENSRIMMKMNDVSYSLETFLLTGIFDRVNLLFWSKTKAAQDGGSPPSLLSNALQPEKAKVKQQYLSGEEFENWRAQRLKGG
jgi:hypothetical protein